MAARGLRGDRERAGRPDARPGGDPFGASRSEALWRRFAGAGATTLLMVVALSWWVPLVPLVGCGVIYVIGVPVSLLLERRWPTTRRSPVPRYVWLGAAVGFGVAVGLALPSGLARRFELGWVAIFGVFTVPAGAVAGGTAAWSARILPERWVVRVALGAPVLAAAITLAVTVSRGI